MGLKMLSSCKMTELGPLNRRLSRRWTRAQPRRVDDRCLTGKAEDHLLHGI